MSKSVSAQFTDRYWCFGDSAAIDFSNLNNPIPGESVIRSRGTCASICDSSGNLLFYCADPHVDLWLQPGTNYFGMILNKNNQIMEGGDSLEGTLWYREMIIIPNPGNKNQFYVFIAGVTSSINPGIFYCLVDISYNGGLGKVIQKNVQLQSFPVCDGLSAVKHGNGRDWWLLFKEYVPGGSSTGYFRYLITPSGISALSTQAIGLPTGTNALRIDFSKSGKKLSVVDADQNMELFEFDRCTGLLSNPNSVHTASMGGLFISSVFSPDETKLYMTEIYSGPTDSISHLYQFDLNSLGGIFNSIDTLATFHKPTVAGFLQRGPDDKIYMSGCMELQDCEFFYLYCDTSYYPENMNIGVIDDPNVLGSACNFQPFSFYLGGHRAYYGLPNNPNYELSADTLSGCDSLYTLIQESDVSLPVPKLSLYYNRVWTSLFINASGIKGKLLKVYLTDALGKVLMEEVASTENGYFTQNLHTGELSAGIYEVVIFTENEKLSTKFAVQ